MLPKSATYGKEVTQIARRITHLFSTSMPGRKSKKESRRNKKLQNLAKSEAILIKGRTK